MGRAKINRKGTTIDMTAMCDVAFLLLSFFILTTKFKPSEAVPISIPSSVAAKAAMLNSDAFVVDIDQTGKTYIELSDDVIRGKVLDKFQTLKGFQLTPDLKDKFLKSSLIATPAATLVQFLQIPSAQLKKTTLPGVPVDSTGGELKDWITAALQAYNNDTKTIHFIIKGDNNAKYPSFTNVINAFKKNDVFKYQLLTTPEGVPEGTELYRKNVQGKKQEEL
jgi:biopolymer transport protein ExbD